MSALLIPPVIVRADMEAESPQRLLHSLAQGLAPHLGLPGASLWPAITTRRDCGVGDGVALPHARLPGVQRPAAAFARLRKPLDFQAPDGRPCDLVYLLVGPDGEAPLKALARAARFFREEGARAALRAAASEAALRALFPAPQQANAA